MGIYTRNIQEGSERLKLVLGNLHYMDKAAIAELMSGLNLYRWQIFKPPLKRLMQAC